MSMFWRRHDRFAADFSLRWRLRKSNTAGSRRITSFRFHDDGGGAETPERPEPKELVFSTTVDRSCRYKRNGHATADAVA